MKRRRRWVRWAVAGGVVVSTLLIAEVALRRRRHLQRRGDPFWSPAVQVHRRSANEALLFEQIPGASARWGDVDIAINEAGFRDDPFPARAADGTRRIVVLGDSVAWGWKVRMDQAFPQALERILARRSTDPVAVCNLAVNGYGTGQQIALLLEAGLALRPDLVVLSYVLNDPDTVDGGLSHHFTSEFELIRLARHAWKRAAAVVRGRSYSGEYHEFVHAWFEDDVRENFRRLGAVAREHGVPVLVAVCPVFSRRPEKGYRWQPIHDDIAALCAGHGLAFLDLQGAFAGRDTADLAFDRWHPTAPGHAIIAEALAAHLEQHEKWRNPGAE